MRSRARRGLVAFAAGALVLGLVSPAQASGAAPGVAVLVGPAAGATNVASGSQLQVRATDADDARVDVTFHAAARTPGTPGTGAPFTLMLMPDTQNYVSTGANTDIMRQQTQWIADTKTQLNTVFVAHLGDIVGVDTSTVQWQRASQYMAILDDAHIPSAVLPGNHDMNLTTGEAPLYEQYFPVSRYANAAWNSSSASYGGYLGQSQFGADPVDRQNMDNYALFSAGGMDFLLLSLEFNAPDYVVDWAKRVLAAYPDRRAIISTHSYIWMTGELTTQVARLDGGNSGVDLWNKLVRPSCSVFLVVNGHFSDATTAEARRTDTNACGKPVQSMLSDYQDRANGGDGWLRYLTFDPSASQIRATTYSPHLGQYETDADSSFTVPYDMTAPAELPAVGSANVASGAVAGVPVPDLPIGTVVDWYATVDDGTTVTRGPTWSYTAAGSGPTILASDTFGRTLTSAWGTADAGGAWTLTGGLPKFAVGSGIGRETIPPGYTVTSTLAAVSSASTDLSFTVGTDRVPDAALYLTAGARLVGTAEYGARIKELPGGAVQLALMRTGTVLAGNTIPGLVLATGERLRVRVQVDGTSPTTIRAKTWKVGAAEPATWQYSVTDSTAGLQSAGSIRLSSYVSSATTGGALVVSFDDVLATAAGVTPPPANVPPTPRIVLTPTGLSVVADSGTSTDPDGTIVSRAWAFGDGGTATTASASHTYASAGTYTVSLTVTDDDGAVATATAPATVTAPPPNVPPTPRIVLTPTGLDVVADSGTSTDPDGTIVSRAWAFGDGATATTASASHTYASAGTYTVSLTVTDDDGAAATTTAPVTVTAPPPPTALATDTFTRSVAGGWGTADLGGAWTLAGGNTRFSVTGGAGIEAPAPGGTVTAKLAAVSSSSADVQVSMGLDAVPTGTVQLVVGGRVVGTNVYGARVKLLSTGAVQLFTERTGASLSGATVPGLTLAGGDQLRVRVQVQGVSPTTIRVRAWKVGTAEPATWQYTATDTTAALQVPGAVHLQMYLSSTAAAAAVRFDDLAVTPLG